VSEPQAGIERPRVAELIVTCAGRGYRGSGYRVTAGAVLTAAHVLAGADLVQVRFEADLPGEWTAAASSWWADAETDLAVVCIPPRPGEGQLSPARFGRVSDLAAVLSVQAVGFPAWKMRDYDGTNPVPGDDRPRYRDAVQVAGSVPVLSNWREGTLEVTVPAPPAQAPGQDSPWAGISGAAVWVGDRIVGVLARHHRSDGLARLAAVRIDRALDRLDPGRRTALRGLLPLPEASAQLPDVIPRSPAQLIADTYRAELADIAPEALYGRERELAGLVQFCAGEQPYAWYQAGPWAGKTALFSWFALYPPAGVDVVSFFITSRYAGQADSDAFTAAMIEQLAGLAGEAAQAALASPARQGTMLRLLTVAAGRCAEAGRRLLLVVDGLDEDTSNAHGISRPSVASLLPARLSAEVRVLVASRPDPALPVDVPGDHPLRLTSPVPLAPSPHARDVEIAAKNELTRLLRGSPLEQEMLGLISAAGGGLARGDLAELTGRPPYQLDECLDGVFGRSLAIRASPDPRQRTYLFAHDTLRQLAEQEIGAALVGYRDRLHAWAATYQTRGWPPDTPGYLLRGYPSMLAAVGQADRLVALATDSVRHDRMLDLAGGDGLALAEIAAATALVTGQPRPDLGHLLLLAAVRDDLAARNAHVPASLPATWAALGRPARAAALAGGIAEPNTRAAAFTALFTEAARRGDEPGAAALLVTAEAAAREITNPGIQAGTLAKLITAAAGAGRYERAQALSAQLRDPYDRAGALGTAAIAAFGAGDTDRSARLAAAALAAARAIADPARRASALCDLAVARGAVAPEEAAAEAAAAADESAPAADPATRAVVLFRLAVAASGAGNDVEAVRLASAAATAATEVANEQAFPRTLREMADLLAAAGDSSGAEGIASAAETAAAAIADPAGRASVLADLAVAASAAGDRDGAERLAGAAETAAGGVAGPAADPDLAHGDVVTALVAAGSLDRAERVAEEIPPPLRGWALRELALAAGNRDRADDAERLAREIVDPALRAQTLGDVAAAASAAGHEDRADALLSAAQSAASEVTDETGLFGQGTPHRGELLSQLAAAQVAATPATQAAHDRAERLATAAEAASRNILDTSAAARQLATLATALAALGDHGRAAQLAEQITEPPGIRARVLGVAAAAAAKAGEADSAARLADTAEAAAAQIAGPVDHVRALIALIAVGGHDRVARLAAAAVATAGSDFLAGAEIPEAVTAAATVGEYNLAAQIAGQVWHPASRATALAAAAAVAARAGDHGWGGQFAAAAGAAAAEEGNPGDRADAAIALATAAEATGNHDLAVQLATATLAAVRSPSGPDDELARISDWERGYLLSRLAVALAAMGEADRAEEFAPGIADPAQRAKACTALAAATADRDHDHAARLAVAAATAARAIADIHDRAAALVAAAESVLSVDLAGVPGAPLAPATGLLAEVIGTPEWPLAVPAAARLSPPAVRRFCDLRLAMNAKLDP